MDLIADRGRRVTVEELNTSRLLAHARKQAVQRKLGRCATCPSTMDEELFERMREWRVGTAAAQGVPAYVVFTDATLTALAERRICLDQPAPRELAIIRHDDRRNIKCLSLFG